MAKLDYCHIIIKYTITIFCYWKPRNAALIYSISRPRNAINECGIAWLPIAEDGDGVFDDDVAIVQFRHMLARDDFPFSIQSVENQKDTKEVMQEYYPRGRYLMPNQVESFRPGLA